MKTSDPISRDPRYRWLFRGAEIALRSQYASAPAVLDRLILLACQTADDRDLHANYRFASCLVPPV